MSRAFVKESDLEPGADALPQRTVSAHPNLVTASGREQLETRLRELEAARVEARRAEDAAALARTARDVQYFAQRLATAQVIEPAVQPTVVRFGVRVTLRAGDRSERAFRLVGEDEADPAHGLLSWVSPLAQTLLGCEIGDTVIFQAQPTQIVRLES